MKSILLTTTALVAFAGAAVAEVTFSGEAALGYNDDNRQGNTEGFYWDGNLVVNLSQELDNGVTAGVLFDFDFADANLGDNLVSGGYVLSLTTENAGLFFGDTGFAAEKHWVSAGDMAADTFSEQDGETVLRGDVKFNNVDASVSYVISDADGNRVNATSFGTDGIQTATDDIDQLSLGATVDLGQFTVSLAYQEASSFDGTALQDTASAVIVSDPPLPTELTALAAAETADAAFNEGAYNPVAANGDFKLQETYGISAATTVAGATVRLAYANNDDTNSVGISASYPVGPVTVSGYYVVEEDSDNSFGVRGVYSDGPIAFTANYEDRRGQWRYNLEGSYDLGNGLVARAGYIDREAFTGDAFYVAGEYDLGSGAALLVSYAEANDADYREDDEVGAPEYQVGTTVEVSFKF